MLILILRTQRCGSASLSGSSSPAGVPLAALAKGTFVPKAQRQAMLQPIEKKISKRFHFVKPLTPGKNGMTYVLRSELSSKLYCLKTISPAVTDTAERASYGRKLVTA